MFRQQYISLVKTHLAVILRAGLILSLASPLHAGAVKIGLPQSNAPARIQAEPGAVTLALPAVAESPGIYRVSLPLRLDLPPGFSSELLQLKIQFGDTNAVWLAYPVSLSQLDATPGAWTVLTRPVTLLEPARTNSLKVSWSFSKPVPKGKDGGESNLLLGDLVIEPVTTTVAVEKVWPEFVHIYPGGTNPVAVTVRNFTGKAVEALVRLEMKTGLDESQPVGEQRIQVPAFANATVRFPWVAGMREYGYAAVATVSANGRVVHTNTEYFSVSTPIWKTALQGSGFISWYGREPQLAKHVEDNRRAYINVEEAFSWQPSSWTDLNPTTDDWWSGQGNGHNSMKGLREWMARSHSNGIKMITYSWPAVSGKTGFDWSQRFPDIMCREEMGVAPKVALDDLNLWEVTHSRRELWPYQSGTWLNNFINLGLLRAIQHHAIEVIRSSRNFGWDGLRFDFPPAWSPIGTEDVEKEFDMLGVRNVMQQIVPEYYGTTNKEWSAEAISTRNVRYFRHKFTTELSEHFALSYNVGGLEPVEDKKLPWFREISKNGGQLMNEAIRTLGAMTNYMEVALWHSEAIRAVGGYSCLFKAERSTAPLATVYSAIFTFASGSHPYLNYGWLGALPGEYTKFMTRYGEYCWDLNLAPVTPEKAGITVESKTPLLWERYVRQRQTNDVLQTVVHLIAKPELDHTKALTQTQVAWTHDVVVKKHCRSEPTVWLLTAEPELTAVRLPTEPRGASYSVTVPSLHFWSLLVWSEKP